VEKVLYEPGSGECTIQITFSCELLTSHLLRRTSTVAPLPDLAFGQLLPKLPVRAASR